MASKAAWPGFKPKWYVLLRHNRQPVSSNCSGVRPLRDAWVATGIKVGRSTGPWGSRSVDALALVVCGICQKSGWSTGRRRAAEGNGGWGGKASHTEHRALISKVNADGRGESDMARCVDAWRPTKSGKRLAVRE